MWCPVEDTDLPPRMAQESEIKPRRLHLTEVAADCYFVGRQMDRHAGKIKVRFLTPYWIIS
ncbi:hypothetical protein C5O23_01415 [Duncaniella muris]|uniref:Uncharacterized protein n=1 Tax=Duncaniella muris TaxID=2094150 RepID=A0A2V1IMX2_9BACT|nr:hypothetical protein C5O23_01415 [Duncaniella muris]